MRKQCDLGLLNVSSYKKRNAISYFKAYACKSGCKSFYLSEELLFSEGLDFKCPDNISAENSQNQHKDLETLFLNWEARERLKKMSVHYILMVYL